MITSPSHDRYRLPPVMLAILLTIPGCERVKITSELDVDALPRLVATGKVVAVLDPEHFRKPFHGSACLAAPI